MDKVISAIPFPTMTAIVRKKINLPQFVGTTLTIISVVALGLQLAWWGWHFLLPAPTSIASNPSTGAGLDDIALARKLFGGGDAEPAAEASASDIRLKGVFAVDGVTLSAAVVNWSGKDQAVRMGQELMKGATLAEVHADYIVVARNGGRERIELDKFRVATATTPNAQSRNPNAGFRLNVTAAGGGYSLSRQELNNVLQDPRQMEFLGQIGVAPGGGVRVDGASANTLAGKLGLQTGDVISAVNGQPVNSAGDLARLYSQFNTLSAVRVEVKRAGSPTILNYTIQN
jgi:general secretion pathway protein C